jgi:hypothetical protein
MGGENGLSRNCKDVGMGLDPAEGVFVDFLLWLNGAFALIAQTLADGRKCHPERCNISGSQCPQSSQDAGLGDRCELLKPYRGGQF